MKGGKKDNIENQVKQTIFLHFEPVLSFYSISLQSDPVRSFRGFWIQFVGKLQDFIFSCLIQPLCDPDIVGILLENKINL